MKAKTDFVKYKGKYWKNPKLPLDYRGMMSLESLTKEGMGISADPAEVYDCNLDEINSIRWFLERKSKNEFPY